MRVSSGVPSLSKMEVATSDLICMDSSMGKRQEFMTPDGIKTGIITKRGEALMYRIRTRDGMSLYSSEYNKVIRTNFVRTHAVPVKDCMGDFIETSIPNRVKLPVWTIIKMLFNKNKTWVSDVQIRYPNMTGKIDDRLRAAMFLVWITYARLKFSNFITEASVSSLASLCGYTLKYNSKKDHYYLSMLRPSYTEVVDVASLNCRAEVGTITMTKGEQIYPSQGFMNVS